MRLVDDSGHGSEQAQERDVAGRLVRGHHEGGQHPPYAGQHRVAGRGACVRSPCRGAEYARDGPLGSCAPKGVDQQGMWPHQTGERGEVSGDTTQRLAEHAQRPLDQPGAGPVLPQQRREGGVGEQRVGRDDHRVGGQLAQQVPPVGAVARHRRVDHCEGGRQVHQQVGDDVRRIGAAHLGSRTEQRGQTPVIRVGQAGDAARKDDTQVRLHPGGRDAPTCEHARVGHCRADGGGAEIHHLVGAPTAAATRQAGRVCECLDAAMTPVTVADREGTGNDDVVAAALEQQVDEVLDHRRRHRRRLGQPGEDDGPTAQSWRDCRQGLGERGRGGAAPDHATGHGRLERREHVRHPSIKPACRGSRHPAQPSLTARRV